MYLAKPVFPHPGPSHCLLDSLPPNIMGQSLNPFATHDPVPEDVKKSIPPVDYTPCPLDQRQTDSEVCEDCGSSFGWFCASTNCDCCGRMLCTRCCPPRYLLHDNPACQACTQNAYRLRRTQMLQAHYAEAGAKRPMSRQPLQGKTILVGQAKTAPSTDTPALTPPLEHEQPGQPQPCPLSHDSASEAEAPAAASKTAGEQDRGAAAM